MMRDCNAQHNIAGEICEGKPLRFNDALEDEIEELFNCLMGFR